MNFDQNFPQLYSAVSKFENIGSNLPQTDINRYNSVNDLIQAISTYVTRQSGQIKDELRRELMMCVRFENLDANTLQ